MSSDTAPPPETPANPDTRVVDGQQEFRIATTNACAFLARELVASAGWYQGAKEFARARKLARAIPRLKAPSEADVRERWEAEPCEFWLSEKLRTHLAKAFTTYLDKGALRTLPDGDGEALEALLIRLGLVLRDD